MQGAVHLIKLNYTFNDSRIIEILRIPILSLHILGGWSAKGQTTKTENMAEGGLNTGQCGQSLVSGVAYMRRAVEREDKYEGVYICSLLLNAFQPLCDTTYCNVSCG